MRLDIDAKAEFVFNMYFNFALHLTKTNEKTETYFQLRDYLIWLLRLREIHESRRDVSKTLL